MKAAFSALTSLILLFMTASAFAHEGHGNPQWVRSVFHYIIESEHLSVIFSAALVAFLFGWRLWRRVMQSRSGLTVSQRGSAKKRAAPY